MSLTIRPLTAWIGAEVSGVDLRQPLDDSTRDEIDKALLDHLVLFFRDQHLDSAQHVAFGRQFGELHIHPFVPNLGPEFPEIIALDAMEGSLEPNWHSDVTFDATPPLGSILRAVEVPPVGRDTVWASMYAAYDALSTPMRGFLDGLSAVHDSTAIFGAHGHVGYSTNRAAEAQLRTTHPVVRTHPVTGRKALFVNTQFTSHVEGLTKAESRNLLEFLYRHCENPSFQVRFHWEPGSVAFWDNRCTQHFVCGDTTEPIRRYMQRVTIIGDRPY
jgi:taurine dioxygenase